MKFCFEIAKFGGLTTVRKTTFILLAICFIIVTLSYFSSFLHSLICKESISSTANFEKNEEISSETLARLKKEWLEELELQKNSNVVEADDANEIKPIDCLINNDQIFQCLRTDKYKQDEVYLPFSFIEKYFDTTGALKSSKRKDHFEFKQSYAKEAFLFQTSHVYHGIYMSSANSTVEYRDRVKCISGKEGVPLSTQWNKDGYFYGIQIAQFGLSHYSKNLTEKPAKIQVIKKAENGLPLKWKSTSIQDVFEIVADEKSGSNVMHFKTVANAAFEDAIVLPLRKATYTVLSFDVKFITSGSISVRVFVASEKKMYTIHYVTEDLLVRYDSISEIFYGIGSANSWRRVTRDLMSDIQRGIGNRRRLNGRSYSHEVISIRLQGEGFVDNITISSTAHTAHFFAATEWILKNQDRPTGGWKNEIVRTFKHGTKTLKSGWISAMGQGQAISLLTRAYFVSGKKAYIKAISLALKPFTIPSANGGCRATFLDKYVWYEEYPTTPSSFVLNGFMFSMIGLYEYKLLLEDKFKLDKNVQLPLQVLQDFQALDVNLKEDYKLVSRLYDEGLTSLTAMLPLYDGGSRTFYDLNHFMLKVQPNVARWDYHTVHLRQLAFFYSVTKNPIFKRYFESWNGYTKGKFAPHN